MQKVIIESPNKFEFLSSARLFRELGKEERTLAEDTSRLVRMCVIDRCNVKAGFTQKLEALMESVATQPEITKEFVTSGLTALLDEFEAKPYAGIFNGDVFVKWATNENEFAVRRLSVRDLKRNGLPTPDAPYVPPQLKLPVGHDAIVDSATNEFVCWYDSSEGAAISHDSVTANARYHIVEVDADYAKALGLTLPVVQ